METWGVAFLGVIALWMTALGDRPGAAGIVPRFGCARPDLGALSTAYVGGLSLWKRVRAWSALHGTACRCFTFSS